MPNKPKTNYTDQPEKDMCQTPPYALKPILPYLQKFRNIYEFAAGEWHLVRALRNGVPYANIHASDILEGVDFLGSSGEKYIKQVSPDILVTNPPFSKKYPIIERCYEIGLPFALLLPSDTLFAVTANRLFRKHGIEMIIMNPRVDFKIYNKGWGGAGSQFSTSWFTWGLGIGKHITFVDISKEKKMFNKNKPKEIFPRTVTMEHEVQVGDIDLPVGTLVTVIGVDGEYDNLRSCLCREIEGEFRLDIEEIEYKENDDA